MDWGPFTWQAFATLVTGALAVAAASAIAFRQMRIAELTLREKVFDRRMDMYRRVHSWLIVCINNPDPGPFTPDDLNEIIKEAEFLFSSNVILFLRELEKAAIYYVDHKLAWGLKADVGDFDPKTHFEAMKLRFSAASSEMPIIFGSEMHLTDRPWKGDPFIKKWIREEAREFRKLTER